VGSQIDVLTKNTRPENWTRFLVSSLTKQGIEGLQNHLNQQEITNVQAGQDNGDQSNFRMAIDRSFEKKGMGQIITGTIFSGRIAINDQIIIAGTKIKLRVRGLHVQNSETKFGIQGQRCAINLARNNLPGDRIKRGAWVTSEQVASPVSRFDAEIRIINNCPRPLAHWTPVHLHHAASESTARVAVLEKQPIKPGEKGLVQIVSDRPVGAAFGDYFIIRDQSARITLGGGKVIDIFPPKRGRSHPERIEWLKRLKPNDAQTVLKTLLVSCPAGVNLNQFAENRNLTEQATSVIFQNQEMIELHKKDQTIGFSKEIYDGHCRSILQALKSWHLLSPEKKGFSESELLKQTKSRFSSYMLKAFLIRLLTESAIKNNSGGYSLTGHKNPFNKEENALWRAVKQSMITAGIRGMTTNEIVKAVNLPAKQLNHFMPRLCREGKLAKLSTNLYILPSCLVQLQKTIEQQIEKNDDQVFTIAEFRNASSIGRNRCIEILECFDAKGITRRIGEGRKLLPSASEAFDRLLKKTD